MAGKEGRVWCGGDGKKISAEICAGVDARVGIQRSRSAIRSYLVSSCRCVKLRARIPANDQVRACEFPRRLGRYRTARETVAVQVPD